MKTNIEKIAKPALPFVIYGIIKGYIESPIGFMIGTLITLPKLVKSIEINLPKDFVRSNAFIVHLYVRLQKRVSKDKAFEITRAVVLCSAFSVMQANFRNVEDARTFENLVKYQKRTKEEGATKFNEMRIICQTEECYEYCVTKCMFLEFYKYMNTPELTSIMCAVDNAIFNTYLPNRIVFERGIDETMPEGASECHFCIRKRM